MGLAYALALLLGGRTGRSPASLLDRNLLAPPYEDLRLDGRALPQPHLDNLLALLVTKAGLLLVDLRREARARRAGSK
ncbi:hypothetical protein ACWGCP_08505 [Streptomyces niveus]